MTTTEQNSVPKPSIFGLIANPGVQFERMKSRPVIWGPLFITLILSVSAFVLMSLLPQTLNMMVNDFGMSYEEARTTTLLTNSVVGLISFPIILLIAAGITYVVVKIAGGQTTYKHMISFTIFIMFITFIGQILNNGIALLAGTDPNVTSINGLIGVEGKVGGLLNTIEIFTIWATVLTGYGLHIVGSLSKRSATIITIIFFILMLIFGYLGGTVS
ncbi:Yip1 family protein [Domibacillus epiphyticus]|uniref:Yip1 domain-containing protein n=1 Tax=Domibacillus epiphyticus TaxID=1714355 RepID=A0A1V2A6B1_9BACI|nr:Yip1 family protein [Domibacillus epiphyticus]OMP66539.1 hypothetical protein BTO28_10810 [Domibacillus epiphyticus]